MQRQLCLLTLCLCLCGCNDVSFDKVPETEPVPKHLYGSYQLLDEDMDHFAFVGKNMGKDHTRITYVRIQDKHNMTLKFDIAEKLKGRNVLVLYDDEGRKKQGIFLVVKYEVTKEGVAFQFARAMANHIDAKIVKARHVKESQHYKVEGALEEFLDNEKVQWYPPYRLTRIRRPEQGDAKKAGQ